MTAVSRWIVLCLLLTLPVPLALCQTRVQATSQLRFYLTVPDDSSVFTAINHADVGLSSLEAADVGFGWTMGGYLREQNGVILILVDECEDSGTIVDVNSQLACNASKNTAMCDTGYRSRSEGQITYPLLVGPGPGDIDEDLGSRDCDDGTQYAEEGGNESPPGDGTGSETPIVVDLDRGGFTFTSAADGVDFDIDRDGEVEHVAWTLASSSDAFLVLDRNGNGAIDDGGELFGDHTDQPPSSRPNGFLALAVFDAVAYGGDEDDWITPHDEVYDALALWRDANHDGVSQSTELAALAAAGVEALSLRPTASNRRDRHGNRLTYLGLVRLERGTTLAVDVFLNVAP
jgi:hypothetical protein